MASSRRSSPRNSTPSTIKERLPQSDSLQVKFHIIVKQTD